MSSGDIAQVLLTSLLADAPYLAAWIAAIVVAVMMLKREGGKAERFLLTGSCLMFANSLLRLPTTLIVPWLVKGGWSSNGALPILSGFNLFRGLVSLAGILCLVYAFWIKFKVRADAHA